MNELPFDPSPRPCPARRACQIIDVSARARRLGDSATPSFTSFDCNMSRLRLGCKNARVRSRFLADHNKSRLPLRSRCEFASEGPVAGALRRHLQLSREPLPRAGVASARRFAVRVAQERAAGIARSQAVADRKHRAAPAPRPSPAANPTGVASVLDFRFAVLAKALALGCVVPSGRSSTTVPLAEGGDSPHTVPSG